jgi:hypothetical protein
MTVQDVTVSLPEELYLRLLQVAKGTQQSFADVLLRTIQIGCPPSWEDVPAEFQMDLAAMDRLSDDHLWEIAHSRQSAEEMERYATLLEKHANDKLSATEQMEWRACVLPLIN